MTAYVKGVSAAECWTCRHFYKSLLPDGAVDLDTGAPSPRRSVPLGNPELEERARELAFERLFVIYDEAVDYEVAVGDGAAKKPSRGAIRALADRGCGMVSMPVSVMVPNKASRLNSPLVACSVIASAPGAGAFVRSAECGLLIASPEWCVLQLALDLPMPQLAELISELCSTYYYELTERAELVRGEDGTARAEVRVQEAALSHRPVPVSCLAAMEEVANGHRSSQAGRQMARAVRYAVEGAASPMETALALMLSLPRNVGGYGLPKPRMNWVIDVEGGRFRVVDAYWPDAGVGLEYDSDAHHAEKDKIRADSLRRNEVQAGDVRLFTATALHLSSIEALDDLAAQLSRALGRPWRTAGLKPSAQRKALLRTLKRRSIEGLV